MRAFSSTGVDLVCYSRSSELSVVDWSAVDCVINCAAATPGSATVSDYLSGNVVFLENLISHLNQKRLIHFSTFSELYRADAYQKSKMLANSLLLTNAHFFSALEIICLPTLDDRELIESIIISALSGKCPVVDDLVYNYMSYDQVAEHVVSGVLLGVVPPIAHQYEERNLYEQVCKVVPENLIVRGRAVDRALRHGGAFTVCPDLLISFLS